MRFPIPASLTATGALAALLLAGCADPTGSDRAAATRPTGAPVATRSPDRGQQAASIEWNAIAREVVARNRANVFTAFRAYALVSVAQLHALRAAREGKSGSAHPSRRAAIGAASVAVLGGLFPSEGPWLETQHQARLATVGWLERGRVDAASGDALGRAAGAAVLQRAQTDGFADAWTGSVPTGPGKWYSSTTPATSPTGATTADARTWFLQSAGQFRPEPPPAYGSPEFLAALAEVRQISDTRTREQDSIAKFWAMGGGTYTPPGYWNEEATTLAARYGMNEGRSTRLLATLNMVAWDAIIASNDAKLAYWLLRPSQADAGITLSITPLPNFPAYPSNHATISSAMAEVLAAAFPKEARRLRAAAEQAALSRVYGGIHYRFDGDAGVALGRRVAEWALAHEKR
jgi:hypothetical protein